MPTGHKLGILVLLLALLAAPVRAAGGAVGEIASLYADFTAAIARGDYPVSYRLFSEQSRAAFSYADFVRDYGPLSAARETILLEMDNYSSRVEGDWGEVRYQVRLPRSGQSLAVVVSFVRNDGVWSLVAARNEGQERLEAVARSLLAWLAGRRDVAAGSADELAVLEGNPVQRFYEINRQQGVLQARPRLAGLRAFYVDAWGRIRQGNALAAARIDKLGEMPAASPAPVASPAPAASASLASPPTRLPEPRSWVGSDELEAPLIAFPSLGEIPDPGERANQATGTPLLPPLDLPDPGEAVARTRPTPTPSQSDPLRVNLPDRIF